jgi:hypothetical protein
MAIKRCQRCGDSKARYNQIYGMRLCIACERVLRSVSVRTFGDSGEHPEKYEDYKDVHLLDAQAPLNISK